MTSYPSSVFSSTISCFCVAPTARIQACGGLMIAVKFFTPNIPRFEMVKVPPCKQILLSIAVQVRQGDVFFIFAESHIQEKH